MGVNKAGDYILTAGIEDSAAFRLLCGDLPLGNVQILLHKLPQLGIQYLCILNDYGKSPLKINIVRL